MIEVSADPHAASFPGDRREGVGGASIRGRGGRERERERERKRQREREEWSGEEEKTAYQPSSLNRAQSTGPLNDVT